jgi:hypothetical protein
MKYKYTIKIHLVDNIERLQEIMNSYGAAGARVTKVERTDNCLYEGNLMKYTLFLEEKINKKIH